MFSFLKSVSAPSEHLQGAESLLAAVERSQAIIEFDMSGNIQTANQNFLDALGYTLDEIKGQHHSLFVTPAEKTSAAYEAFWSALRRGEFQSGEFKRVGKGGRDVFIQASYNPIFGRDGRPYKVVKFASDVTARKLQDTDTAGQIAAIKRAQAVIEFKMDGTILDANDHFLTALGYSLGEIVGKNHSLFVEPEYRNSSEYREFWAKLNRGEYIAARFRRVGKGGRDVYIQASYNPIFDLSGHPIKVVKYATDVTEQVLRDADAAGQIAAIGRSQAAIEFSMDGTILTANANFLKVLGYSLDEIKGQHHSLFVDPVERNSAEYREFWAKLNRGEFTTGEYKRVAKGGREIYIQGTYNPIFDVNGKPIKVVKFAIDITERRLRSDQLAAALQSLAAAVEEMGASGREIAQTMVNSRDTADQAAMRVTEAGSSTQKLVAATSAMNGILGLIADITGQINLLALNATIESARAGEAGRGFAVVATEVKNLANQASRATDQIASEINGMRDISAEVVAALNVIRDSVDQVHGFVLTTVGAIEEQNAVSQEMARNMNNANREAQLLISNGLKSGG